MHQKFCRFHVPETFQIETNIAFTQLYACSIVRARSFHVPDSHETPLFSYNTSQYPYNTPDQLYNAQNLKKSRVQQLISRTIKNWPYKTPITCAIGPVS